ncbi:MAG: metalloregulator ArsR/SmtB family transcription factor [Firmicutes bacterium]|nr:metalloregulator ArsR/SmtB family transcription factor [Bacillota bacterium]
MTHIAIEKVTKIQQALSDPTRIRIISMLMGQELCVCEIVEALEEPQYKISRHLTVLKNAGLVRDRRQGLFMHYCLNPDIEPEWKAALSALFEVWKNTDEVSKDLKRLNIFQVKLENYKSCCNNQGEKQV